MVHGLEAHGRAVFLLRNVVFFLPLFSLGIFLFPPLLDPEAPDEVDYGSNKEDSADNTARDGTDIRSCCRRRWRWICDANGVLAGVAVERHK